MSSPPSLKAISGTGGKGPACFLVETRQVRLLLDLGYGPQPGLFPDVSAVGEVDAVLLSHAHRDHAGALGLLSKLGSPPVYATETVARALPREIETRVLPLRGTTDVLGVDLETGRSGHAPGGIWMRAAVGEGLLYMGDHSRESILYAFDTPPEARTIIIDACYGTDDTPFAERLKKFEPLFGLAELLLPVPADGRGPEIALYVSRKDSSVLRIDDAVRSALHGLAATNRASLRGGIATEIARIAETAGAIDGPAGVMLASRADATAGEAAQLVALWENAKDPAIVFTGYVPVGTPAERLVRIGRASYLRWNVHPRLSDNAALVRATRAKTVIPAFCAPGDLAEVARALAPAQVTIDMPVTL